MGERGLRGESVARSASILDARLADANPRPRVGLVRPPRSELGSAIAGGGIGGGEEASGCGDLDCEAKIDNNRLNSAATTGGE
jgi:hypothetical protein